MHHACWKRYNKQLTYKLMLEEFQKEEQKSNLFTTGFIKEVSQ
jgi:hypothetical protein